MRFGASDKRELVKQADLSAGLAVFQAHYQLGVKCTIDSYELIIEQENLAQPHVVKGVHIPQGITADTDLGH